MSQTARSTEYFFIAHLIISSLDDHLPSVAPGKHPNEGFRQLLEPLDHRLPDDKDDDKDDGDVDNDHVDDGDAPAASRTPRPPSLCCNFLIGTTSCFQMSLHFFFLFSMYV